MVRKVVLIAVLVIVVASLTGCHTVQGIGRDITSVAQAGEDALAEWTLP